MVDFTYKQDHSKINRITAWFLLNKQDMKVIDNYNDDVYEQIHIGGKTYVIDLVREIKKENKDFFVHLELKELNGL